MWLSRYPCARPSRLARVGSATHIPMPLPLPFSCGRGKLPSRRFFASREMRLAQPLGRRGAPCTQSDHSARHRAELLRVSRPAPSRLPYGTRSCMFACARVSASTTCGAVGGAVRKSCVSPRSLGSPRAPRRVAASHPRIRPSPSLQLRAP